MNFYRISSLLAEKEAVQIMNHVLMRLTENWRTALDKNIFTGTVLTDLSKAFEYIPHNLLIAKLHACGMSFDTITFWNSYLKNRKEITINNIFSAFEKMWSGISQGSILGLFLFNIFLNDLFLCIKNLDLLNFVDVNTITATRNTLTGL